MRKVFWLALLLMAFMGCKKKNGVHAPEAASLLFPEKNSECTTGTNLNAETTQIEFRWAAADHTETYELNVSNIATGIKQTISTSSTSAKLPIAKGEPFSWYVVSKNTDTNEVTSSETWYFYNSGFRTSYAPFPAEIIAPESGESVFKNVEDNVVLQWSGADLDDDIASFEVYFGTSMEAMNLLVTNEAYESTYAVPVSSGTTYYWKVITKDAEGNASDTGVFQFKVL